MCHLNAGFASAVHTQRGKVRSSDALKDEIARASALIAQHGSDQDCVVHFRGILYSIVFYLCNESVWPDRHLLSGVSSADIVPLITYLLILEFRKRFLCFSFIMQNHI